MDRSILVEEIAPVAEVDPWKFLEPLPRTDETYTKFVAVGLVAERLLESFDDRVPEDRPAPTPKEQTIAEYLDVLDETVQVVHDVCQRQDHDAIALLAVAVLPNIGPPERRMFGKILAVPTL